MDKIDRRNPIPLYYQLYERLKKKINNGEFKPGTYLPSENNLAASYNVSRFTVREALSELAREGLIEKIKGRGSLVVPPKNIENLTGLHGFTEEARLSGHTPTSLVIENRLVEVPPIISEKLGLPIGSKILLLKRLRLLDNIPYAVEWAYINTMIDARILKILDMDMSKKSLYDFFRKTLKLRLLYADETLEVTKPIPETQKLLKISKDACVVKRRRFTYIEDGKCIEYVQSLYRGDRYKFTVRLYEK
ncbi:MAG TPA: GntR family transcriptional regulator [Candidatus Atribacteria bacterium]|nr:GntR family transcriptional regulator [Candidatus Atribacteria bacterium]